MIVPYQDILEFVGTADSQILESTHKGVEAEVKNDFMFWDPESVTHVGKLYDGTGYASLWLDEMHIDRVTRVATVVEDAISIKNTSDASNAYVEVTSTGIRTVVTDGANVDDTTTLFADYATITLMVAQINTIGKGWSAEVTDSDYTGYNSNTILQADAFYVGSFGGSTASYDYLSIAGEPIQINVYKERGEIRRRSGSFPVGSQNIAVNYVSGWALADMPADLQLGIKQIVKLRYDRKTAGTAGLKAYSVDGVSETFDTGNSSSGSASDIEMFIPDKYKSVVVV